MKPEIKNPKDAYQFALRKWKTSEFKNNQELIENLLIDDPKYCYLYSKDILGGRFPKAEKTIAQSPIRALQYAENILKGPFKEAEQVIASVNFSAESYHELLLEKGYCFDARHFKKYFLQQ